MFQIIVDSAANIPAVLVKKYDIKVISFVNYVDGEKLVCFNENLSPEEERAEGKRYYDAVRSGKEVKTSLVNSGDFYDFFKPYYTSGEDILYFSLSKNISGTYNAARIAAEELKTDFPSDTKIILIDSLNASLAQGILAIYASEMRSQGLKVEEIAEKLSTYPPKMNGVFTVEDLKYLRKTGRISSAAALIGTALNIKPILRGNKEGYIVQYAKCRGRKKALKELIELVCNNIEDPEEQIIGIAHSDCYEESLYVMEEIQKRVTVREFINTSYDFCTGSHTGPGTIALFFMAKDRELKN